MSMSVRQVKNFGWKPRLQNLFQNLTILSGTMYNPGIREVVLIGSYMRSLRQGVHRLR